MPPHILPISLCSVENKENLTRKEETSRPGSTSSWLWHWAPFFSFFFFNYENSLEKLILSPSEPYIFWSCEMNQVSLFWGQYLLQGRSSSQSFNASLFPLLLQWILRKISWSWDRSPDLFFLFYLCVFGKWLISTLHIGMVYIPTLSFAREVWCCRGRSVGSVVILTWNWTLPSPLN